MIGQPITVLLSERSLPGHRERVARYRQSRERSYSGRIVELIVRRKNGEEFPAEASISKLMLALVNKDIYAYCVDLLGAQGLIDYDFDMRRADAIGLEGPPGSARKMFLRSRANSIEGGTSEILRNVVAERVLGLPAEARADKDVPWKDLPR